MSGRFWTDKETEALFKDRVASTLSAQKFSEKWGKAHGRSVASVRLKLQDIGAKTVKPSPYPSYDKPLEMHGDALILTDVELPFHHAEFINRCLKLASVWGVRQLILGGDLLHFDNLSGWEPSWVAEDDASSIGEKVNDALFEFAQTLNPRKQGELMAILGEAKEQSPEKNLTEEMNVARRELRRMEAQFDKIDLVLGNHEGRFLRALDVALGPGELLKLLEAKGPKWRTSPYYYSVLCSGGRKFQIEHPRNTAKGSAWKLASKFACSVIMGHSHHLNFQFDPSGEHYAIESGHCVDEAKLPYASQRHNMVHAHILGAVIVRNGFPHLLHAKTPWAEYEKMA